MGYLPAVISVPHNEQGGRNVQLPFVIDAAVLNSPHFGVYFSAVLANDSDAVVSVDWVAVVATPAN